MAKTKYCVNCQSHVRPHHRFSWLWFLFLLVVGLGIGGVIYVIYHYIAKSCPQCKDKNWGTPPQASEAEHGPPAQPSGNPSPESTWSEPVETKTVECPSCSHRFTINPADPPSACPSCGDAPR